MATQKINISYRDIEFIVEFEHTAEEKQVMYYSDGSGYPGSPETLNIYSIYFRETDFTTLFDTKMENQIKDLIYESFED
jgi:hypothetical protein